MAKLDNPDSIVTESRMEVFADGCVLLVVATFKDGKNMGITTYTTQGRNRHDSKGVF